MEGVLCGKMKLKNNFEISQYSCKVTVLHEREEENGVDKLSV